MVDAEFVRRHSTDAALRDGTRVRIRPIVPEDKALLVAGFERLSPESRYRRFMAQLDRLSDEQLAYLTEIDYDDHYALIAIDLDNGDGAGVARYVRLLAEPEVAEAAVTVIDDYQGRGVGKALLELAARSAIEQGIREVRAWVQADNAAILHVLERLGARPGRIEGGLREVTMPLPENPDDLPHAPGLLLRAAAAGEVEAEARVDRPVAMRLDRSEG